MIDDMGDLGGWPARLTTIRIESGGPADVSEAAQININGWTAFYRGLVPKETLEVIVEPPQVTKRIATLRSRLDTPGAGFIVARDAELRPMLGFVSFGPTRDLDTADTAEVYAIYVRPDVVSHGIGSSLLSAAERDMGAGGSHLATLWVLEGNWRARRFYESNQWKPDGTETTLTLPGGEAKEVRYRKVLV